MKYVYSEKKGGDYLRQKRGPTGLLIAASWEERSRDIVERVGLGSFDQVVVVKFKNPGRGQKAADFFREVRANSKKSGVDFARVEFDSVRLDRRYQHEKGLELFNLLTRGINRWVVDLSCLPRALVVPMIMLADEANLVREMVFHYSRPCYEGKKDVFDDTVYKFTEGDWTLIDPAFARLNWAASLSAANIISVGFEYESLKKIIYQRAQDANCFLIGSPGISDEYTQKAEVVVRRITRAFEEGEDKFYRIGHSDFCGALTKVLELVDRYSRDHGTVSLISAGGKIHGLAMCFAKVERPDVSLKVRMPRKYVENNTKGNGEFDVFVVENVFAPI